MLTNLLYGKNYVKDIIIERRQCQKCIYYVYTIVFVLLQILSLLCKTQKLVAGGQGWWRHTFCSINWKEEKLILAA